MRALGPSAHPPLIDRDGGNDTVGLDPSKFVATIDNPWRPSMPGSRWVYEAGRGAGNKVVVTNQTRQIMGIRPRSCGTSKAQDGKLVEETSDWDAQDRDGNRGVGLVLGTTIGGGSEHNKLVSYQAGGQPGL